MRYLVKIMDSSGIHIAASFDHEPYAEDLAMAFINSGTIAWIQEVAE